jgi:hypothetical protein
MLFTHVVPRTKSKELPISGPLLSKKKLILFTRVAPRTKSKGLPLNGPHLLLVSARASPRTKSKELHRYVLQIYYFINQVFRRFCSSVGVVIPLYHPNNKPSDPDRWFNILTAVINIQEVRGIYLYLSSSSSSSIQKKKITEPWGCRCHRTRQD